MWSRRIISFRKSALGILLCLNAAIWAQVPTARDSALVACGAPPVPALDAKPNIFTEQQETWLGDIQADMVESAVGSVRDRALSAHLQSIADRLVAVLPPTSVQFRVTLIDSDDVNGFSIAGGHIYISRKLAAVSKSDDELAGVLGHEIGHIISHQFAFETTAEMSRLLKVSSLGNEADIRTRYSALLDAEYTDKHPQLHESDEDQLEADAIGIYATAAAGYNPRATAEFWNRVFFVKGKTGSRLGDLFGITSPNQKRLRSIERMVASVRPTCGVGTPPSKLGFATWHEAVIENQAGAQVESSAALKEVALTPPLQMELDRLRFSPDGKSILAQDEGSIFVLSREPFALRYRIDAPHALPAYFSPDSQSITFSTPGMHTEQWSAQEKHLLAVHELLSPKTCYENKLSPDGRTLMCVELNVEDGEVSLSMLDTATSQVLWEKKNWFFGSSLGISLIVSHSQGGTAPIVMFSYSSDRNTLLMGSGDVKLALDLRNRTVMKTGSDVQSNLSGQYAFVGNDKVLSAIFRDANQMGFYSFPSGKLIKKFPFSVGSFEEVSNPGKNIDVLIFGMKNYDVGIGEVEDGKAIATSSGYALDEFDRTLIAEGRDGTLFLRTVNASLPDTSLILPLSPIAGLRAVSISEDGKYLAMSTAHRGAIWQLNTGSRVAILPAFTDALWTADDTIFFDIPKQKSVDRHIGQLTMTTRKFQAMTYKVDDQAHMRYGRFTDWQQDEKKKFWKFAMHDPANDAVIWSRTFPDAHFSYTSSLGDRDLIFDFALDSKEAKEVMKQNPALASAAQAIPDKKSARLIEVLDGKTGADAGKIVVQLPPNFAGTDGLNRVGDLLYVEGVDDRTSVYSLSSGKQVRQLFGYIRALDTESGRICTANRLGEAKVYDTTGNELAHFLLGSPIQYGVFHDHGNAVIFLTADQKVKTLAVTAVAAKGLASTASNPQK